MSFRIWIGREYDNTHENVMVADAIRALKNAYSGLDEPCHVLVNFRIPGDPPAPGGRPYTSEIDMAVLKGKALVIVDLKNYNGPVDYGDDCQWVCHAPDGDIEVKGGRDGRTPHGQLCDYRRQMIRLVQTNQCRYLGARRRAFDFRRFTGGMVLFPDCESERGDVGSFQNECGRWLSVVRMRDFAEKVCAVCGGRDSELTEPEIVKLVKDVFRLYPAHMVGDTPKLGAENPPGPLTVIKTVTVEKPVEVRVEVPTIVRDEYGAIILAYESDDPNPKKIADMSDVFRRLVARERKRRFKETQIRSLGTAAEMLLRDDPDLSSCAIRLFRLSAAVHHDPTSAVSQADVDETFKTLCRVAEKFCGEPMPPEIDAKCDRIAYRRPVAVPQEARPALQAFFLEVKSVDPEWGTFTGIVRDDEARTEYVVRMPDPDFGLAAGMVVCAVTPVLDGEGVWKASEIVLEPDYLLSPQAIGRASEYANGGLHFWLSAIQDDPSEKYRVAGNDGITMQGHVALGNFANTCLAERAAQGTMSGNELVCAYFRENAVELSDVNPPRAWLNECTLLNANLSHLFSDVLPGEHGIVGRRWQIEAPLYSSQYGLSARADALSYSDDSSSAEVIELKSGKWDNYQGNRPKREHVCQPSFYADILGFSRGLRRDSVRPFLYYAKTIPENRYRPRADGRLFLRPSFDNKSTSALIRYFTGLRNEIVMVDVMIRNGRLRELLDSVSADSFRRADLDAGNVLWLNYRLPELKSLLSPFQNASELEKRYFYRMLQFVADENFVAKVGDSGAEIGRGGDSMGWRLDVRKRQEAGLRLSELERIADAGDSDSLGRIVRLTFVTTHNRNNSGCSVREGDGVGIYLDREGANITNSAVFAASVEKLEPGRITLSLDDPQPEELFGFGPAARFAVEHVPMSGTKNYKSLWHFLAGDAHRRELVLGKRPDPVDPGVRPPVAVEEMERRYSGVSAWLEAAWRARDWYLLWGPPGTGKTSHAMRALVDEAMAVPNAKILLLAYTYKATDKICEMLEDRIRDGIRDAYLRIGKAGKCDARFRMRIPEEMNLGNRDAVNELVGGTRIFVSTVSTLGPKHAICGLVKHFDLAVVDEASQLLDVHMLPLFCSKRQDGVEGPLVGKFVFIGDDRQLPAVVQQSETMSKVVDEELRRIGIVDCRESFFSRLRRVAGGSTDLCGMLDTQFRMHPMIADFCNRFFYEGRLRNGNAPRQLADLPSVPDTATPFERYVLGSRLGFFPIEGGRRGGKINENEAKTCVDIIRTLLSGECRPNPGNVGGAPLRYTASDIGVIVPFRNQISCLREKIGEALGPEAAAEIVVDTVERNQGGERPVIIFSTVITAADQADWISARRYDDDDDGDELSDPIDRKLNVAVTRAQERFYLVGSERVLGGLRAYGDLLRWIADRSGFCEYSAEEPF